PTILGNLSLLKSRELKALLLSESLCGSPRIISNESSFEFIHCKIRFVEAGRYNTKVLGYKLYHSINVYI
ncbi:MAG: hypothetical protein ACRC6T_07405, partial [Sarcina sp.]